MNKEVFLMFNKEYLKGNDYIINLIKRDNIEEKLAGHHVPEELVKAFITTLNECEFARFAPGNQNEAMDKIYSSAIDVISKMENIIKR